MTINGGIFVLQQVYNKQVSKTWPSSAPKILTPIISLSVIDEPGSVVINVNTKDYEGQTLYWTISGVTGTINSSDFTAISGSFVVQSNNFGTFTVTTLADGTPEGEESFKIEIRTESTSGPIKATSNTITINDTSFIQLYRYGRFGGGSVPGPALRSTVERIDFINDTVTASTRGPLSLARSSLDATGNDNYGWFGGGSTPASTSRIDRINYAADTFTASSRGPLSSARYSLAATGNDNYGWFGGGVTLTSVIDRIEYAVDTPTALIRGTFSSVTSPAPVTSSNRRDQAATGNNDYGWFGGGRNASTATTVISRVDRITYVSDTGTTSTRGSLVVAKRNLAATGNDNFGWYGGGVMAPATIISRVDRISFSSDTGTAIVRGPLSSVNGYMAASGNDDYGWFGGGFPASLRIERITFASDSVAASNRGNLLTVGRISLAASSGLI